MLLHCCWNNLCCMDNIKHFHVTILLEQPIMKNASFHKNRSFFQLYPWYCDFFFLVNLPYLDPTLFYDYVKITNHDYFLHVGVRNFEIQLTKTVKLYSKEEFAPFDILGPTNNLRCTYAQVAVNTSPVYTRRLSVAMALKWCVKQMGGSNVTSATWSRRASKLQPL